MFTPLLNVLFNVGFFIFSTSKGHSPIFTMQVNELIKQKYVHGKVYLTDFMLFGTVKCTRIYVTNAVKMLIKNMV
jgi:hypothetical protein